MNKYIRDAILEYVAPFEFIYKKNTFLRIQNDMVQGFMLRSKKAGIDTILEVFFASYPLSCE